MGVLHLPLFLSLLASSVAGQQCYFPDGSEALGNFPCDPDAEDSVCCGGSRGTVCISNKLCGSGNGNVIRGACTDQDWTSAECPYYCLGAETGGTDLISCANVTDSTASYCCDHNAGCCDGGVGRFEVLPEAPEIWATWDTRSTRFLVVGTVFSSGRTTSTSIPSTSSPASTSAPTTTTSSSSESDTATIGVSDPGTTGGPSEPQSSDEDSGLSTAAIAGIAAGSGVFVILSAAAAYLVWRHRRKNNVAQTAQSVQEHPQVHQYPPPAAMYEGQHTSHAYPYPYQYPYKGAEQYPQEFYAHELSAQPVRAELPHH
ncbi:hypothetical protein S40293_04042 [Stachybotrys chartarum IBT 40293]|nr:hypothetical protein S40293_04042 [Stachybotrys chartarum IBT 40293]